MSGLACADGVPVACNPRVNLGGDQAMTGSCNCVEGCNSHFPCPKCLAPKTEMCELDLQKVKAYAVRTRDQIHTYSHTKLGAICPGCDLKIVEKVDDPKTQVRLAKLGDPAPPVPAAKRGKGVTHSSFTSPLFMVSDVCSIWNQRIGQHACFISTSSKRGPCYRRPC